MNTAIDPTALAQRLTELWSPRVIGELDDCYLKVARVHGTFGWHAHTDEDELFFVLQGRLRIQMEVSDVEIGTGELFVVPRGVRHNPVADEVCLVLLIERKSTRHTGESSNANTRSIEEQLRPL